MSKIISKQEYELKLPFFPILSTFYALPKIHKGVTQLRGRPIVSGVNNLTQNASVYIDKILRGFVTSLPSYTRDTTDLLLKHVGVSEDENVLLASIDVEALFSSIPHTYGYRVEQHFLGMHGIQYAAHSDFTLGLLSSILEHNSSLFDSKIYHQLRGTGTRSPCTPTYANLPLGWWENILYFADGTDRYTLTIWADISTTFLCNSMVIKPHSWSLSNFSILILVD